jgi:flagellar motor switch protein FliN/FliY
MSDDLGSVDGSLDDWGAALAEQAEAEQSAKPGAHVQMAEFDALASDNLPMARDDDRNMDMILDIPVTIAMEIGRTKISIRNLLQLNQGSVVELDRLAGEPMDVLVNGTLVAHGEVVVVNEKFGIRLTDVVSPAERVKKLK